MILRNAWAWHFMLHLHRIEHDMAHKIVLKAILTALLLAFLVPASAHAIEPIRVGQEDFLSRAVWAEDRLWLLSDAGQLSSLVETDTTPRSETAPEAIRDMCVSDGQLLALTANGKKPAAWTLRRHGVEGWVTQATINAKGEYFITLICGSGATAVLTTKRLITLGAGAVSEVALDGELDWGLATTLMTADTVYAGFNKGEWGGGMRAIDRKTGRIRLIENKDGDLCGGLLNTECDPVNGLATLPWNPDCVAAAIGLVHMDADGHIVTVCGPTGGDQVRMLYRKQFGERYPNMDLPPEDAYQTMPFFGLATVGGKLLAVGGDGLYTIGETGAADFEPMPNFKEIGPFHVSFAKPGVILVLTSVNQRHSVSGATPILVIR